MRSLEWLIYTLHSLTAICSSPAFNLHQSGRFCMTSQNRTRTGRLYNTYSPLPPRVRYQRLAIPISARRTPELKLLSCRALRLLLAARSGHGDFEWYHRRFRYYDAVTRRPYGCGQNTSSNHIFNCHSIPSPLKSPARRAATSPNDC